MTRRRNRKDPYPTIAQARAALSDDNPIEIFETPLIEVLADQQAVKALVDEEGQAWIDAAVMLDQLGFQLWADGTIVDEGQVFAVWKVRVPDYVADEIALVIWDNPKTRQPVDYMLHKSTRHDGWQLTSYASDGLPWGHSEIYEFDDAFKSGPMDVGQSVGGVVQVVMKDGTVHTLPGRKPVQFNPQPSFNDLLVELDRALTGKEPAPTASARTLTEEQMVFESGAGVLYLSDGGYSRVALDQDTGRLTLDRGLSRPRVIAAWSATNHLRSQIENRLRNWIRSQGAEPSDLGWGPNPSESVAKLKRRLMR